jgi:hypothetical protein
MIIMTIMIIVVMMLIMLKVVCDYNILVLPS